MKDPYIRRIVPIRTVDGDTIRIRVDLGWNIFSDHNTRLLRVNAPELRGETYAAGLAAKQYVEQWLVEHVTHSPVKPEWPFTIHSEKDDAFGRYLIELYCGVEHNLNDDLIASGNATLWSK